MPSFADAMAVKALDSNTYETILDEEWCIGSVPHGGYITSLFLSVAKAHFTGTLAHLNQPHTITQHLQFARRTGVGPATFTVKTLKLGARVSTIHATLSQKDPNGKEREEVFGYITNSNLSTESGISLPTAFSLHPPPYPADLPLLLREGEDSNWCLQRHRPFGEFRKATQHTLYYLPRHGQVTQSIIDEWLRFAPYGKRQGAERFTNETFGFVSDCFPQIVEGYKEVEEDQSHSGEASSWKKLSPEAQLSRKARFWYPTMVLNLEIKKLLPPEGVEWLFVRVRAKVIRNGRMDLEVVVMDAEGDVVAISNHVALIMGTERNLAKRGNSKGAEDGESKI